MTNSETDQEWIKALLVKLESLQTDKPETINALVKEFATTLGAYIPVEQRNELYTNIDKILQQVIELKQETFYMGEDILKDNFIPDVATELHSVITQTEKSVEGILDVSDNIRGISQRNVTPEIKADLVVSSTKLLELCNFQDLTGQIIQRIIKRLTAIESTIDNVFRILSQDKRLVLQKSENDPNIDKLLNGPQKEEDRPSQSQVDDLFNNTPSS